MNLTPELVTALTGTTGAIGVISLALHFFTILKLRALKVAEASIREIIQGQGLFEGEWVIEILREIPEQNRLQALKELAKVHKISEEKASLAYSLIKKNIDITTLQNGRYRHVQHVTSKLWPFFISITFLSGGYDVYRIAIQPSPPTNAWSFANCKAEADRAENAFFVDHSNVLRVEGLIQCRNPVGYEIRGSEKFFKGDYSGAEFDFDLALKNLPADASNETIVQWRDNLASTQIETGKYSEAVDTFSELARTTSSEGYRWDLGRALLYQAKSDPSKYQQSINALLGVSQNFAGKTQPGKVQLVLAAAYLGKSLYGNVPAEEKNSALESARSELCTGILKNEQFWRNILNGLTPYPNASFVEEIRLLRMIGGGNISCPRP